MPEAINAIDTIPEAFRPPAPEGPTAEGNDQLGSDTFLQLLVAQLKYQDPSSPADSTQFLAQTAQFTMVEKLTELAESSAEAKTLSRNMSAASLVGRHVEWITDEGTRETGQVASAKLGSAGPVLVVNNQQVPFDVVTSVIAPKNSLTA